MKLRGRSLNITELLSETLVRQRESTMPEVLLNIILSIRHFYWICEYHLSNTIIAASKTAGFIYICFHSSLLFLTVFLTRLGVKLSSGNSISRLSIVSFGVLHNYHCKEKRRAKKNGIKGLGVFSFPPGPASNLDRGSVFYLSTYFSCSHSADSSSVIPCLSVCSNTIHTIKPADQKLQPSGSLSSPQLSALTSGLPSHTLQRAYARGVYPLNLWPDSSCLWSHPRIQETKRRVAL